jgi:nucleotide-binding universal stress UspA family protein
VVHIQSPEYRERLLDHYGRQLQAQVEGVSTSGCQVEGVLATNRAYREILDRAAALPADLIVMGAHGHNAVELMVYGSTTQHVVRRAACPVLTVRA